MFSNAHSSPSASPRTWAKARSASPRPSSPCWNPRKSSSPSPMSSTKKTGPTPTYSITSPACASNCSTTSSTSRRSSRSTKLRTSSAKPRTATSSTARPLTSFIDVDSWPYADLLDTIPLLRVKLLNGLLDFEEKLTVDEVEVQLREAQNSDFIEGKAVHLFQEITAILDFMPDGYGDDDDD